MKQQQIKADDLAEWLKEEEVTFAMKGHKRLTANLSGKMFVYNAGKLVYRGHSVSEAVEAYNGITEGKN